MQKTDTDTLIEQLKALYNQTLDFIDYINNGHSRKQYGESCMNKFIKKTMQLNEYIKQVENGGKQDKSFEYWCNLLGDILVSDKFYHEDK